MVTPVNPSKLAKYLEGYDQIKRDYLITGFTEGFKLEFVGKCSKLVPSNLKSTIQNPEATRQKINEELEAGRFLGPFNQPPFKEQVISPIGVVPKKAKNKFRLITHLSYQKGSSINDGISSEFASVKYGSVGDAIKLIKKLGTGVYMAKSDIKHAFRLIPLHESQWKYLIFKFENQWYIDICLPMGAKSSCAIFESFSSAIEWIMRHKLGIKNVVHILDDFLILNVGKKNCKNSLNKFLEFCLEVGIPISTEKTLGPCNIIEFAGIELDATKMISRLPEDKIVKCKHEIKEVINKSKVSLKELQRITGLLNFACIVVYSGRVYLRRIYNLTIGLDKKYAKVKLDKGVKEDLEMWLEFLEYFNGKNFFMSDRWFTNLQLNLYTDSSKNLGFGGYMGTEWFHRSWDMNVKSLDITTLELYPILVALNLWNARFANLNLIIHTDNQALVAIINAQTVKKNNSCLTLLRKLIFTCLKYNILIKAQHIPGRLNYLSDLLSRSQVNKFRSLAPEMSPEPISVPMNLSLAKLLAT